jgi:ferredoxin
MGANVSVVKNGKVRMEIDSRKCNDCGRCINICVHHAREFRDVTERFITDLKKGEKISIILEPSFYAI